MRFLKHSGILEQDAPKAKSSSPWNVRWTRDTTTLEDIKRMNAVTYRYDRLGGGDVRHPADGYAGALVSMDRSSEAASKPGDAPVACTVTMDGDVNDA